MATVGGMGLTGVILWAPIRLAPIPGPALAVDTDRVATLDDALALLRAPGGPHRVAWLDLLGRSAGARHGHPGRACGGRPGAGDARRGAASPGHCARPGHRPRRLAGRRAATGHGAGVQRAALSPRAQSGSAVTSRVWASTCSRSTRSTPGRGCTGRRDFSSTSWWFRPAPRACCSRSSTMLRRVRVPCYLAVLKDFGAASPAPLSFPLAGWTLALDLPRAAPRSAKPLPAVR